LDIIQVNRKLQAVLKRSIPIDTFFEFSTIAALAGYLSTADETKAQEKAAENRESTERLEQATQKTINTFQQLRRK